MSERELLMKVLEEAREVIRCCGEDAAENEGFMTELHVGGGCLSGLGKAIDALDAAVSPRASE